MPVPPSRWKRGARPPKAGRDAGEEAKPLEELLKSPRAVVVLLKLHESRVMNMRQFVFMAGVAPRNGKTLREKMEFEWGLLVTTQGEDPTELEIKPTKEGDEIARILLSGKPIFEHAKKKARQASERK